MKKALLIALAAVMLVAAGCSKKEEQKKDEMDYHSAEEVLNAVYELHKEEEKVPAMGGDLSNPSIDAAGTLNLENKEEIEMNYCLSEEELAHVDDGASLLHAMNANIFTGAAFHLTDQIDPLKFADGIKENISQKHWLCGVPGKLFIQDIGNGYVISVFGDSQIVDTFKKYSLELFDGSEILADENIAE